MTKEQFIESEEMERMVEDRLCGMMKKNSVKLLQLFLVLTGTKCVETNATDLTLSCEATIKGGRYAIKNITTIEKIN